MARKEDPWSIIGREWVKDKALRNTTVIRFGSKTVTVYYSRNRTASKETRQERTERKLEIERG